MKTILAVRIRKGIAKQCRKCGWRPKYNLPVICLIDTPGAYPGIGAEERGQAQVIAENMYEMSRLKTPIVCIVIGEGGSGGALGIGVGDRVARFGTRLLFCHQPGRLCGDSLEGAEHAEKAASALKFTSKNLLNMGIVDDVIEEPLGAPS